MVLRDAVPPVHLAMTVTRAGIPPVDVDMEAPGNDVAADKKVRALRLRGAVVRPAVDHLHHHAAFTLAQDKMFKRAQDGASILLQRRVVIKISELLPAELFYKLHLRLAADHRTRGG